MPEHLLVARLSDQSGLAVKQQPSQDFSDSVIIIRMLSAGVCGTDLAMLSGARPCRAEVLGHEAVGIVLHAPDDSSVPRGARVIFNPVHSKQPHVVIGHTRDGAFRELFCIDAAEAVEGGFLVICPRECALRDSELVLAEPLGSVLYSFELLREKSKANSLLIRGSGTVGILAARVWSILTGASATLVSRSEAHARWLRESIRWPANVRVCCETEVANAIRERSSGREFDAAILCCSRESAPEGLRFLLNAVQDGATIDLMAGFPAEYRESRLDGVDLDNIRWNNICGAGGSPRNSFADRSSGKSVYLVGHRGTAERHILKAIELLSHGIISIDDVPHCLLTLEQLPGAVNQMLSAESRRRTKWVKAIVAFSREGCE